MGRKHVARVLVVLAMGCARHELLRPIGPVPGGTIYRMDGTMGVEDVVVRVDGLAVDGGAVTLPLRFTRPYATTLFGSAR